MAETFDVIHPFYLVNGELPAMEFRRANYDSALAGDDIYEQGDLVTVTGGSVIRSRATAAASVTGLILSGQDWDQKDLPPADPNAGANELHWFLKRGVPLNEIPEQNEFVFTYQGATADGTDHVFAQADLDAVMSGAKREILWNATEKSYTVRAGTTTPAVQLKRVFRGGVDDKNVMVVARILEGALLR
jgi:hypothetical protein